MKLKMFNQLHIPRGQEIILKVRPIPNETCSSCGSRSRARGCSLGDKRGV